MDCPLPSPSRFLKSAVFHVGFVGLVEGYSRYIDDKRRVDVEFVIGIAIVKGNIQGGEDPRFISCNNVHIVIKCIKCTFERVLLRINKETLVHR